jgi:hypothetical protein
VAQAKPPVPPQSAKFGVETIDLTTIDQSKIVARFTASSGDTITLPADFSIASIIVAEDSLLFRDAAGNLVLVTDGFKYLQTINFTLGTTTLPGQALATTLKANGLEVPAAGPDTGPQDQSSGGDFTPDPGAVSPPFPLTPLLPPTGLAFSLPRFEEFLGIVDDGGGPGDGPTGLGAPTASPTSAILDEDGFKDANTDTPTALEAPFGELLSQSGNLVYDFGPDGPSTPDMDIQFDAASLNGQYTSNGEPIIWVWNDTTNTLTGFVDTGTDTGVLDPGDRVVLTFEITDVATGAYTATLMDVVDQANNNNEDGLVIPLVYTVKDATGDTATAQHDLTIGDDVPVQLLADPQTGTVEEEQLADGIEDLTSSPDIDLDTSTSGGGANMTTAMASGSLASFVSFGADGPGGFSFKSTADVTAALAGQALTSGGLPVKYDVTGNVLTAYIDTGAGGNNDVLDADDQKVFTVELSGVNNADWKFTLLHEVDHPVNDTEDVLELDLTGAIQASDNDGDVVMLTGTDMVVVSIIDDIPVQETATSMGVVEEEHLLGGNEDITANPDIDADTAGVFNNTTLVATGSLATVVSFGQDGPGSFNLKSEAAVQTELNALGLKSGGATIKYAVTGNTLTAYLDETGGTTDVFDAGTDTVVFTYALSGTNNEDWTFTLARQIDHHPDLVAVDDAEGNYQLDLTGIIEASDNDGDTIMLTGSNVVSVKIIDDIPVDFEPDMAFVKNDTNAMVTTDLDFAQAVGADKPGSVTFKNIVNGDPAVDANGVQLTFDDGNTTSDLYTFVDATGTLLILTTDDTYVIGDHVTNGVLNNPDGTEVISVALDAGTDSYKVTVIQETVLSGQDIGFTATDQVGGGNVAFKGLEGGVFDALLSGQANPAPPNPAGEHHVNTNAKEIGIGPGNSIDDLEILRVDLVDNLVVDGGEPSGFSYGNHVTTTMYRQDVTFVNPSGSGTASFIVSAYLADNDQTFIGDGDDAVVNIDPSGVQIFDPAGDEILPGDWAANGISVVDAGVGNNSVLISGIDDEMSFKITTASDFNAVEIQGAVGTQPFKLGDIRVFGETEALPVDLEYDVTGSDFDGDSIDSTIGISILPDDATTILGTNGNDTGATLTGTGARENIVGYDGNDELFGMGGADNLFGGNGADTLDGGAGADVLKGGDGADVFKLANLEANISDLIVDYDASEGDAVDVTMLFDVNGGDVADFVSYNDTTGELSVDTDGTGVSEDPEVVAVIETSPGVPAAAGSVTILYNDSNTGADPDTTTL